MNDKKACNRKDIVMMSANDYSIILDALEYRKEGAIAEIEALTKEHQSMQKDASGRESARYICNYLCDKIDALKTLEEDLHSLIINLNPVVEEW